MNDGFIVTVSGKRMYFNNPTEEQIDIKDIAFSLANQCRFNGHIPFYSVAEHCVAVSAACPTEHKLAGLLHDASEAYLSDIPSPIKQYLPDYIKMEEKMQTAINTKYGVDTFVPDIKIADKEMLHTEAYYLMDNPDWIPKVWSGKGKRKPYCLPPEGAYRLFMEWFVALAPEVLRPSIPEKKRIVLA